MAAYGIMTTPDGMPATPAMSDVHSPTPDGAVSMAYAREAACADAVSVQGGSPGEICPMWAGDSMGTGSMPDMSGMEW